MRYGMRDASTCQIQQQGESTCAEPREVYVLDPFGTQGTGTGSTPGRLELRQWAIWREQAVYALLRVGESRHRPTVPQTPSLAAPVDAPPGSGPRPAAARVAVRLNEYRITYRAIEIYLIWAARWRPKSEVRMKNEHHLGRPSRFVRLGKGFECSDRAVRCRAFYRTSTKYG